MKVQVITDQDVVGFHNWPDAPEKVGFLAEYHRHIFRIRTGIDVGHDEREEEIFLVEARIANYLEGAYDNVSGLGLDFGPSSCETIARGILEHFIAGPYAINMKWVEVLEDGRGGARISL